MKIKAFSLLELIVSITIMSILMTFLIIFFNKNLELNKNNLLKELEKIDILSFNIYIIKKIEYSKQINISNNKILLDKNQIYLEERTLYFNKTILLQNVNSFIIKKNATLKIDICLEKICQKLVFCL